MTDLQFYTLIAISAFSILVDLIFSVTLVARLLSLESRMIVFQGRMDAGLVALENGFDTRFNLKGGIHKG